MAAGTETDEYLTRNSDVAANLKQFESELKNGTARLQRLDEHLRNLGFLREVFYSRFPTSTTE
jgi:hypothetical protein